MNRNVNHLLGLLTLTAGAVPQTAGAQSKDPSRPNILCIVTEDISCYLSCYGDPAAKTPNLDNFATQAIRYTNMHTPNGVSAPSRYALITGCYPSANGGNYMRASQKDYQVVTPEYMRAYTEYMRAAGYFCVNRAKCDYQIGVTTAQWDENGGKASWTHCPEGQPFLAIYNIGKTHEHTIWADKDPLEVFPEDVDMSRFPYLPDDPIVREDLARMYTNIAIMDRLSQKYFNEVKEAGIEDNTIIIWYSDNGGPIPRGKRSIYNTGTNVPFMVKFPDGYRAGEVEDRLLMFVDIPATILSLAGISIPEYMDGQAFLGSSNAPRRNYIYAARDRYDFVSDHSAGVRDSRFQYIRNFKPEMPNYLENEYRMDMPMMRRMLEMRDNGELNEKQMLYFKAPRPVEEFYDILNDPYELTNLAEDENFRPEFERLKAEFDRWNNGVNILWNTKTEDDWIAEFKPGGKTQTVQDPIVTRTRKGYSVSSPTPGASFVWRVVDAGDQKTTTGKPHWNYYSGPIARIQGKTLLVKACRAGFNESTTVSVDM